MPSSTENRLNLAKNRYAATVITTLCLIASIGAFGCILFLLGDGINTLYTFAALSALGLVLHRPKKNEFLFIFNALSDTGAP